jgi:carbon-monoxide dehydrogenase medium subunit/2-furoyl-CoA dehydrogenase FAD binding subunit
MNLRLAMPSLLVDLSRVAELAGIRMAGGELCIGAMTRQKELAGNPLISSAAPLISAAVPFIGHLQTRNRGTIGGSLAHADPAAELPLVMSALDARLVIRGRQGERIIPVSKFITGALTTVLEADEILTEVRVTPPAGNVRIAFREFARRHGDYAIAAAAVQLGEAGGGQTLQAALAGVGAAPYVCTEVAEAFANGFRARGLDEAVERDIRRLQPQSDLQASGDYRLHLARLALTECLQKVFA